MSTEASLHAGGIRAGAGIRLKRLGRHTIIEADAPRPASPRLEQWQPVVGTGTTGDPPHEKPKIRVSKYTSLGYDADNVESEWAVTALDTSFAIDIGQVMYLELSYNSTTTALTTVELKCGDRWDEYPNPCRISGGDSLESPAYIEKSYFPIAYGVDATSTDDPPGLTVGDTRVIRCVYTPLFLDVVFRSGFVFEYPTTSSRVCAPPAAG